MITGWQYCLKCLSIQTSYLHHCVPLPRKVLHLLRMSFILDYHYYLQSMYIVVLEFILDPVVLYIF